jgi:hypothetical protein
MLLLIAALLLHMVTIGRLVGLGFLLGCADVFVSNSAIGLVRNLVASSQLERANGVVGAISYIGNSFVGPALGSVLFTIATFLPFGRTRWRSWSRSRCWHRCRASFEPAPPRQPAVRCGGRW